MTPMRFGQWHQCRLLSVDHTKWSMTPMHFGQWHKCRDPGSFASPYRTVNDTDAFWSMTRMQVTECESHSVVNDTNAYGQWHECSLICHWPVVNDTNACIRVIDRGQWHECLHICHWPVVNDTNACIRVIDRCHWLVLLYHGIFQTSVPCITVRNEPNNHLCLVGSHIRVEHSSFDSWLFSVSFPLKEW